MTTETTLNAVSLAMSYKLTAMTELEKNAQSVVIIDFAIAHRKGILNSCSKESTVMTKWWNMSKIYCSTLETDVEIKDRVCQMVFGFGKKRYPCTYVGSVDCSLKHLLGSLTMDGE